MSMMGLYCAAANLIILVIEGINATGKFDDDEIKKKSLSTEI